MKSTASNLAGKIKNIESAREGNYVLGNGKVKSRNAVWEKLDKLESEDRNLAAEVLHEFDNFYLRTHEGMYRALENMWENYRELSQEGKKMVRFGPMYASAFLKDFYDDRAHTVPEKKEFVDNISYELQQNL